MSHPVLELRELTKFFGEVRAVEGVSFQIQPGEALALLGPNGSGKTTILRAVAGLLRPDSGSVTVAGYDLERDFRRARQQFSYVPQQAAFAPNLTIREILEFHAKLRGVDPNRVAAARDEAGLDAHDEDRPAGELSGGMRQRLSLAVAALPRVPLMVLDEPTANLDPGAAIHLREIARRWRDEGRALLFATHVLTDVEELADRVVVLVQGRAVAQEDVGRLRANLRRFALLRVDVGRPTEAHRKAALQSGAVEARVNSHSLIIAAPSEQRFSILEEIARVSPIHHFETEEPSLEQVYLKYVTGERDADV